MWLKSTFCSWMKPSGTNSVKPPVRFWMSRSSAEVRATWRGLLDVAVHQRRGRAQPDLVRGRHDLDPAIAASACRGEMILRISSSRISAAVPGIVPRPASTSQREVVRERHPDFLVAEVDLLGRERVDVQLRELALQRDQDLAVVGVVLARVDAALDADLGGAARDRVARLRDAASPSGGRRRRRRPRGARSRRTCSRRSRRW